MNLPLNMAAETGTRALKAFPYFRAALVLWDSGFRHARCSDIDHGLSRTMAEQS